MGSKILRSVISALLCVLLSGCFTSSTPHPVRYSEQVGVGTQREEDISIPRKKYQTALTQGSGVNEVRLVEIFRREGQTLPQYHMFDIRKGGPYQMLGLQEGDILLAANDYVIFDPTKFRSYVIDYLRTQNDGSITVSREGVTILYRYHFND